MDGYCFVAVLLRFSVVLLLLIGAERICFQYSRIHRHLLGAAIGGIYAWCCMIPALYFLGNILWQFVFLFIIASATYGWHRNSVRPAAVFMLLNLVLDSMVSEGNILRTALGIIGLIAVCYLGFCSTGQECVPVSLSHGEKKVSIMALRDTGNTLIDPLTGRPVLVIGAQVVNKLVGLTQEQLKNPVENMNALPGLRLIPYSTVGQSGAMMLAMWLKDVKIGEWKGGGVVAFAPECLGSAETYQALTGGKL